ncbi:MAG: ABC transporter ATP-binding protein [Clostridia bacterium]|nr:ABC transporter ATP-binding protein [Clostridia bacterium]
MLKLCELPKAAEVFFEQNNIDVSSALAVMRSDMAFPGTKADTFIVLTQETLYVAEGVIIHQKGKKGRETRFDCFDKREYSLSDMSEPKTETLISTARVTAVFGNDVMPMFDVSSACKHEANVICSCIKEIKKDGKIDEAKHKDERSKEKFCPKCGMRYPDQQRKVCPKCLEKTKLVKKMATLFGRYKGFVLLLLVAFLASSALSVAVPYVSNQLLYGEVLEEGGSMYGMIGAVVLLIIGVRIAFLIINLIVGTLSSRTAAQVTYDLKMLIFDNINKLSLSFFTSRQTGGLMTQVNGDSTTLYWFFCDGFPYLVTNVLTLLCVMGVMLAANPLLTLFAFITVPIFFFAYKYLFLAFDKLWARNWARRRALNSLISDVLNGMRVVKSFSRENEEGKRFDNRNRAHAETVAEAGMLSAKSYPLIGFLLQAGLYVVWGVGGWQVMKQTGNMDYAALSAFIAYFGLITGPLQFFADVSNWWSECLNAMQRLFEIKDSVPEVREAENPVSLTDVKGDVKFDDVVFSYEENRVVIDHISFEVPAGKTVGIVGKTGAGKSTLVNLLTRLYDVTEGGIYIDGINVKDISFKSLRENVAIVSQETYLFRGTIKENIRYARPDATDEEVMEAARIASAHQFIIKYPEGYETMVGLGGKDLSGGEKQRISIARAVLRDPRILILDEATAAMDTQTERQIQASLTRLAKGRTTIMIAHRLSTLRDADFLVVIENGKMPEKGTATELLKAKGVYYKLYKMQAEALKTIGIEE